MGFRVNTNTDALRAYYQLAKVNNDTTKAQMRLSSGKRIMSVADDTSGFNVGTSLKGKVAVMKGAQSNIASAKNMLSTAEGGLLGVNDLLTKIEGKLSDATNPTNDRKALENDIEALAAEIDSILSNTKFNDTKLLGFSSRERIHIPGWRKHRYIKLRFCICCRLLQAFNSALGKFTNTIDAGGLASSPVVSGLNSQLATIKSSSYGISWFYW